MPEKYQDFLAANVLSDGNIITYRSLSRALKVHSNTAKEMLYEFHHTQNARKPNSVHATYLLYGKRKPVTASQPNGIHPTDGEDSLMSDGSFMMSSSMPGQEVEVKSIPVITVILVAEEQLEEVKASYETITSIHIHSLEPGPLSNIHILSDCNRKIAVDYAGEDPLETWKQYGTIHNASAKRRTTHRPPPIPPAAAQPAAAAPASAALKTNQPASNTQNTEKAQASKAAAQSTTKPAQAKRAGADFFKSTMKNKEGTTNDQRAGAHRNPPGSLGPSKPEAPTEEDISMKDVPDVPSDVEEGGDESEETSEQREAAKEKAEANRKAKLEREANLRRMMEDDDNDDNDDESQEKLAKDEDGDEAMLEPDDDGDSEAGGSLDAPVDSAPTSKQPPTKEESEQQSNVTVSNGRRRGRRRVMKKKTTKDAEGYLVTKEEPVWESFSEDEVVAPPVAVKPTISVGANAKAKKAGGSGKPGQGNIMSFFGKK